VGTNSFCIAPKQHTRGGSSYGKSIPSSKLSNSCSFCIWFGSGLVLVLRVEGLVVVVVVVDFLRPRRVGLGGEEVVLSPVMEALGVKVLGDERKGDGGEGRR